MIPRKMNKEYLQGFLLVKKAGPLPCETVEDRAELQLLARDYLSAVVRGVIVVERGLLPVFSGKTRTRRDSEVLEILFKHMQKNLWIPKFMPKEFEFMCKLIEESKVDIGYISINKLQKLMA